MGHSKVVITSLRRFFSDERVKLLHLFLVRKLQKYRFTAAYAITYVPEEYSQHVEGFMLLFHKLEIVIIDQ